MARVCVVDFDETLLSVDSTKYMVFGERLYLRLPILFWGVGFLLVRLILPRAWQYPVRRRLKYLVLGELVRRGEKQMIEKYSKILSGFAVLELLDRIKIGYSVVYVISSAWRPLVAAVLARVGAGEFKVIATELTPDFENFHICWHQEKAKVARSLGLAGFDLFTDSYDDKPLMRLAKKVIMVS